MLEGNKSGSLPRRVDTVIIGGGAIGVATALFLARRGQSVALCEKGRIAGEQSSRNWGWCRQMGRDLREIPLAMASLDLWAGMNAMIGEETGFRRTGILYLCENEADEAREERFVEAARQWSLDSRMVDSAAVARLVPGAGGRFTAGCHTPSDGRAEPSLAVDAMARAAARAGASILRACAARGIETEAGRVAAVITEHGAIACRAAVLAGGAFSRLFAGNIGIDLPQLRVLGTVARTAPMEGPTEMPVGGSDFAFSKRLDGGYTFARRNASITPITPDSFRLFFRFLPALRQNLSELRLRLDRGFIDDLRVPRRWSKDDETPFERVRTLDPRPDARIQAEAERNLKEAFPVFAGMRVVERWSGAIDVTPDGVPILSEVAALPGFFIATGMSGHGFGLAPGAGHLMADLVCGDKPLVDPAPFSFERFS